MGGLMKKLVIVVIIILSVVGYVLFSTSNGAYEPAGRIGFVKLANPDMYPDHPHSKLLAQYARDRNSKCAMVVHFGGSSNYRNYKEQEIQILSLAYVEDKELNADINWNEVWQYGIYGIPDNLWDYKTDGKVFDTLDEALAYINSIAKKNGQEGPIPLFYHGTVRKGNPMINQGCGFPLYYHILRTKYGVLASYYYVLTGMVFPYLNLPFRNFELKKSQELQYYYNHGMLDYE